MDILYYWKNFKEDLNAQKIGWFISNRGKLDEVRQGFPDHIWIIKTPHGRKGDVQLLAKLRWSDTPVVQTPELGAQSIIYYDPYQADSVWFNDSGTDGAIAEISAWVRKHFPSAVRANYQGDNGLHALRGEVLKDLKKISDSFAVDPFMDAAGVKSS